MRPIAGARFAAVRPAAIVRCASPAQVAAAIAYARFVGRPLALRSGGHCFAGNAQVRHGWTVLGASGARSLGAGVRGPFLRYRYGNSNLRVALLRDQPTSVVPDSLMSKSFKLSGDRLQIGLLPAPMQRFDQLARLEFPYTYSARSATLELASHEISEDTADLPKSGACAVSVGEVSG